MGNTEQWCLKKGSPPLATGLSWGRWGGASWVRQACTQTRKSVQRLTNQIQQNMKRVTAFEKVDLIAGVEDWFDIPKSISAIFHTNLVKENTTWAPQWLLESLRSFTKTLHAHVPDPLQQVPWTPNPVNSPAWHQFACVTHQCWGN